MPSESNDDNAHPNQDRHSSKEVTLVLSMETLQSFSDDVKYLWCAGPIPILESPPDAFTFLREYVSKSRPCILRNVITTEQQQGPLMMSLDDLVERCQDDNVITLTVDVTPDGHGDCVRTVKCASGDTTTRKLMFVKPHEQQMAITEFRERLRRSRRRQETDDGCDFTGRTLEKDENGRLIVPLAQDTVSDDELLELPVTKRDEVLYYSRQNDCLRTEWRPLFESGVVPNTIRFAEQAFGVGPPDAINLWIGDERALSSTHKDHYENLFYVASGEKVFTLYPPADALFLPLHEFDSGVFHQKSTGEWIVHREFDDENQEEHESSDALVPCRVKWIAADHEPQVSILAPLSHPMTVHVMAGEMLYLPALWFHCVTQTCETVGINYWYDMHFDSPYWCYFNFLQQLQASQGS